MSHATVEPSAGSAAATSSGLVAFANNYTFSCKTGYMLASGNESFRANFTSTCGDDGDMSGLDEYCIPIPCSLIYDDNAATLTKYSESSSDANVSSESTSSGPVFADQVMLECKDGFRASSSAYAVCGSNSTYAGKCGDFEFKTSPPGTLCKPVVCHNLDAIRNNLVGKGSMSSSHFNVVSANYMDLGSEMNITCNVGYRYGNSSSGIQSATVKCGCPWDTVSIACVLGTCDVSSFPPSNSSVLVTRTFGLETSARFNSSAPFNTTWKVKCNRGFYLASSPGNSSHYQTNFSSTCGADMRVSRSDEVCREIVCDNVDLNQEIQLPSSGVTFGTNVTVTCRPGYRAVAITNAASVATCSHPDVYLAKCSSFKYLRSVECKQIVCNLTSVQLQLSGKGTSSSSATTLYHGESIEVTCNTGYRFGGNASARSSSVACGCPWVASNVNCTMVQCDLSVLKDLVTNGSFTTAGWPPLANVTNYNTSFTVECDSGYSASGGTFARSFTSTCGEDGVMSNLDKRCVVAFCPQIADPNQAFLTSRSFDTSWSSLHNASLSYPIAWNPTYNASMSFAQGYRSEHNSSLSYVISWIVSHNDSLEYLIEVASGANYTNYTARCTAANCSCTDDGAAITLSPWNKDCGCMCTVAATALCSAENCSCATEESSSGVIAIAKTHSPFNKSCGCTCQETSRAMCSASNCSCSQGVGGGTPFTHTPENHDCGCGCEESERALCSSANCSCTTTQTESGMVSQAVTHSPIGQSCGCSCEETRLASYVASVSHGAIVTVTCNTSSGFRASTTDWATCEYDEEYNSSCLGYHYEPLVPDTKCAQVRCGDLDSIRSSLQGKGNISSASVDFAHGETITVTCKNGYRVGGHDVRFAPSSKAIRCSCPWAPSAINCSIVHCPLSSFSPANATILHLTYGQTYLPFGSHTVQCKSGFRVKGAGDQQEDHETEFAIKCDIDGLLKSTAGAILPTDSEKCVPVPCPSAQADAQQLSMDPPSGAVHNDEIAVTCNTGYRASTSSTSSCDNTSSYGAVCNLWDIRAVETDMSCQRTYCDLTSIRANLNGVLSSSEASIEYDGVFDITCNYGTRFGGSAANNPRSGTVKCECPWVPSNVNCTPVQCLADFFDPNVPDPFAEPSDPDWTSESIYEYGTSITISCLEGFFNIEMRTAQLVTTCQDDGSMSNITSPPTFKCIEMSCKNPADPNGIQVPDDADAESIGPTDEVTVTCNTGYVASSSSASSPSCTGNQKSWRAECGTELEPSTQSGIFVLASGQAENTRCRQVICPAADVLAIQENLVGTGAMESPAAPFRGGHSFNISCNTGHRFGDSSPASPRWSEVVCDCPFYPSNYTCVPLKCDISALSPANGRVLNSSNSSIYGTTLQIKCNRGYLQADSNGSCIETFSMTCDDDGFFRSPTGSIYCEQADTCHEHVVNCSVGYRGVATSSTATCADPNNFTSTCLNKCTSSGDKSCNPVRCEIPSFDGGNTTPTGGVFYNDTLTVACDLGYRFRSTAASDPKTAEVACESDCQLSTQLECRHVVCNASALAQISDLRIQRRVSDDIGAGSFGASNFTLANFTLGYAEDLQVHCAPETIVETSAPGVCARMYQVNCLDDGSIQSNLASFQCVPRFCDFRLLWHSYSSGQKVAQEWNSSAAELATVVYATKWDVMYNASLSYPASYSSKYDSNRSNCSAVNCSCTLAQIGGGLLGYVAQADTQAGYDCGCSCEEERNYCTPANCSCSQGIGGGVPSTHSHNNHTCGCGCSKAIGSDANLTEISNAVGRVADGGEIVVVCKAGYRISSNDPSASRNASTRCHADCNFAPAVACHPVACPARDLPPTNAHITGRFGNDNGWPDNVASRHLYFGEILNVTCDTTYVSDHSPKGTSRRWFLVTCNDTGYLQGAQEKCVPECELQNRQCGPFNLSDWNEDRARYQSIVNTFPFHGDGIDVPCAYAHRAAPVNQTYAQCSRNHSLEAVCSYCNYTSPYRCKLVQCDTIDNASTFSPGQIIHGKNGVLGCRSGYRANTAGELPPTCSSPTSFPATCSDCEYLTDRKQCDRVMCNISSVLVSQGFDAVSPSFAEYAVYEDEAEISCLPGFRAPKGDGNVTLQYTSFLLFDNYSKPSLENLTVGFLEALGKELGAADVRFTPGGVECNFTVQTVVKTSSSEVLPYAHDGLSDVLSTALQLDSTVEEVSRGRHLIFINESRLSVLPSRELHQEILTDLKQRLQLLGLVEINDRVSVAVSNGSLESANQKYNTSDTSLHANSVAIAPNVSSANTSQPNTTGVETMATLTWRYQIFFSIDLTGLGRVDPVLQYLYNYSHDSRIQVRSSHEIINFSVRRGTLFRPADVMEALGQADRNVNRTHAYKASGNCTSCQCNYRGTASYMPVVARGNCSGCTCTAGSQSALSAAGNTSCEGCECRNLTCLCQCALNVETSVTATAFSSAITMHEVPLNVLEEIFLNDANILTELSFAGMPTYTLSTDISIRAPRIHVSCEDHCSMTFTEWMDSPVCSPVVCKRYQVVANSTVEKTTAFTPYTHKGSALPSDSSTEKYLRFGDQMMVTCDDGHTRASFAAPGMCNKTYPVNCSEDARTHNENEHCVPIVCSKYDADPFMYSVSAPAVDFANSTTVTCMPGHAAADNASAVVTCSGSCGCLNSEEMYHREGSSWAAVANDNGGTISSGGNNYSNGENCEWLIVSAAHVSLHFTSFSTEPRYDYVVINECESTSCRVTKQLANLSGDADVSDVIYTSSTGLLQIVFTSDGSVTESGFEARWSLEETYGSATGLLSTPPCQSMQACW